MTFDPQEPTVTATFTLADGADVLAYVSQCELCGQRAITLAAHGPGWTCPRCAEIQDRSPYASGQDCGLGTTTEVVARTWLPGDPPPDVDPPYVYTAPGSFTLPDDDGPDLRKIQG